MVLQFPLQGSKVTVQLSGKHTVYASSLFESVIYPYQYVQFCHFLKSGFFNVLTSLCGKDCLMPQCANELHPTSCVRSWELYIELNVPISGCICSHRPQGHFLIKELKYLQVEECLALSYCALWGSLLGTLNPKRSKQSTNHRSSWEFTPFSQEKVWDYKMGEQVFRHCGLFRIKNQSRSQSKLMSLLSFRVFHSER